MLYGEGRPAAAGVVTWKTKVLIHLPSAYPNQAILRLTLERLPLLHVRVGTR